ncbi:MAG: hypothetical protein U9Q70_09600 [Chloroflexota bacterium]|nr:hypothetical protein [Chloroflexota bacterium]
MLVSIQEGEGLHGADAESAAGEPHPGGQRPGQHAGELVLPPSPEGIPVTQFARSPYLVGFETHGQRFVLLTVHIKYGDTPKERLPELQAFARHIAAELRDKASADAGHEETNLIVLGDFNIDKRGDNPLFQALIATGLVVPAALSGLKTTYGTEPKFYDHIAWFMGDLNLAYTGRAGVIDFSGAVYQELTLRSMSYRVSDHFPLWTEFSTDASEEQLAKALDLEPAAPEPLSTVPD